jgi:hypothetical protein
VSREAYRPKSREEVADGEVRSARRWNHRSPQQTLERSAKRGGNSQHIYRRLRSRSLYAPSTSATITSRFKSTLSFFREQHSLVLTASRSARLKTSSLIQGPPDPFLPHSRRRRRQPQLTSSSSSVTLDRRHSQLQRRHAPSRKPWRWRTILTGIPHYNIGVRRWWSRCLGCLWGYLPVGYKDPARKRLDAD